MSQTISKPKRITAPEVLATALEGLGHEVVEFVRHKGVRVKSGFVVRAVTFEDREQYGHLATTEASQ